MERLDKITNEVKYIQKSLGDQINTQEHILTNKIHQQMEDSQKNFQDKIVVQDKHIKETADRIGKKSLICSGIIRSV